jgi:hypothetical protein
MYGVAITEEKDFILVAFAHARIALLRVPGLFSGDGKIRAEAAESEL